MKVNHPAYHEWPCPMASRSSHACSMLCRSQYRARNNMYAHIHSTGAPYHGSDHFQKWVTMKIFFMVTLNFFISWVYDIPCSFWYHRSILWWTRFISKMGDWVTPKIFFNVNFSRSNCTFSFYGIWHFQSSFS